ncbi:MAG TPA: hypothetical protein VM533_16010 [Fimbriiglobus sp.]|nr:hypothetical protein [Fimbriiglobus sp.]
MRRTVRLALGAVVLLASSVAMAQSAATTEFYPLKKDTKWVYKVGETTITVRVASVAPEGATLETLVNDKAVASEVIQVKADGVFRTQINKAKIEPPVMILKLEGGKVAAKGAKWDVNSKIQDQPVKGSFSIVEDKEKVKVPAGEFESVVVNGPDFEIAGTKTGVKYWFAKDKGVVKLTYSIAGNDAVLELKEFTDGK